LRSRKRLIRYGLLTANFAILAVVVTIVVGAPSAGQNSQQNSLVGSDSSQSNVSPLDQLSSADIAANVALVTSLTESTAVRNQADSENALLTITPSDDKVVARPQVVATERKSKEDIKVHKAVEGDTVASLAEKYGVSSDSIKWSNNLTSDSVTAGSDIIIPPAGVNGLVYTVAEGDTPESLAEKYGTNKDLIIAYNDAEISGLIVGERIIIPDGRPPTPRIAAFIASPANSGFAWGGGVPVYGGGGYDYGYCTWYAAMKRAQSGRPVPSNLGNASTWKLLASRAGIPTGNVPQPGAIIWTPPRDYYGHVGYVESVNPDGSVNISEMNTVGWGVVSYKTLSAEQAAGYGYIY
jgi:surface antigen/LysM repeat protein